MTTDAQTTPKLAFGIRFPPAEEPEEVARLATEAEEAGFSYIWAVDSPLLAGGLFDPYVDLVAAAQSTTRARLGPAVSPLYLRSPVATAAAILSLDRISKGRAVLGLGTGGSALVTLGVSTDESLRYTGGALERQGVLREQVALYRRLFAGEPVSFGRRAIQLTAARPIKIYLAASGPRMLELAGAIADGVMIHVGIWEPAVRDAIERIHRGARAAGRDPAAIDIVCSTYTAVSPTGDRQADIRHVRPEASFFYSVLPRLLEQAGFDTSQRAPAKMPYPDMTHAYDWEEAMAAAESYIPDGVVEAFCLIGPPEAAIARIEELRGLGVTQLYVRGASSYHLPRDLVHTFRDHILPAFR
jgi:5,10-methylenetetrahydromethanopterin reductase